ncbi:MAG: hypothetical protein A3C58_02680 [Candidatus Staskawiczbacteria bacterium RIFCSPHIGHO2_02_FULL_34_10]|uniref:Uncharacterized protein n=1 Tax=Candidatus Staskawiczbacteria bacterium RIFCSPHIGHO2_02_FULL_34_10 TaxID=1802205 RepID=A0A1G2HVK6_9BACT|nr:MAG: hypothetical protein A3C58_02680 [Candidatus Staskawiczbacteria bacterium RIFCSPHIGHO2_02_FULL_34_10]
MVLENACTELVEVHGWLDDFRTYDWSREMGEMGTATGKWGNGDSHHFSNPFPNTQGGLRIDFSPLAEILMGIYLNVLSFERRTSTTKNHP